MKENQIIFEENRIIITLEQSKTNQTGKKENIYIYNTSTCYSPFKWLPMYYNMLAKHQIRGCQLFPITQRQFRCFFKKKLEMIIGDDINKYSSHSLRKGAAYTAALNGAQDSQIKVMGRWRSECFQIYTSVSNEEAGEKVTSLI